MTATLRIQGRYASAAGDWGYDDVRVNGTWLTPERSLELRRHSPTGFAWGYDGSGPAQLALAILLEAGLSDEMALRFYQRFKREVIGSLDPHADFDIEVDLQAWLVQQLTAAEW